MNGQREWDRSCAWYNHDNDSYRACSQILEAPPPLSLSCCCPALHGPKYPNNQHGHCLVLLNLYYSAMSEKYTFSVKNLLFINFCTCFLLKNNKNGKCPESINPAKSVLPLHGFSFIDCTKRRLETKRKIKQ